MSNRKSRRSQTEIDPRYSGWILYKRLIAYAMAHKLVMLVAVLGFIIFAATGPATTEWLGWTVDAIDQGNYADIRVLSPVICVLIVLVRGIGGFMGSYSLAAISNHMIHKLRCELMARLLSLPSSYFDKSTPGKLVSKLTYDVLQITGAASNAVAVIIREGLVAIGLLGYLLYEDWKLSLTFLIIAPLVGIIVSAASKRFRRYSTQMQDSMGDVTQVTNETIKGHHVIRTFNAEDFMSAKLVLASERNRQQNMKMAFTRSASTPLIQLIVSFAMALLVWMALSPDFLVDKTSGDFVAFFGAAGLLAKPIRQLTNVNSVIQRGLSAAFSIFSLIDQDSEVNSGSVTKERVEGRIEFRDVSFKYNEDTTALHNISFIAEPGQTIALVGKSGSGKSSLVKLLPRFYEYNTGAILVDDLPVKEYELHNLRHQISLVSQQVVLFNGTIAENIAYGEEEMDMKKITQAASDAHAMEFVDQLSGGLNTPVGDDASLLSGGQRQRIAIARALLKDAPVLIFDEATSALDSESELHIQQALDNVRKGRTTFVIAHRLSTIENADMILVMDKGQIIEAGTHAELLAKGSAYSRLHAIQFSDNGSEKK
jgi:ATP-binding cassette, subfamily B, bacterial MsbA